ncbi:MAG: hypothetical protein QOI67_278 [Gaiellaceae bacterium]|nr:hypothetical protein [Gaiellaceae bacterium]
MKYPTRFAAALGAALSLAIAAPVVAIAKNGADDPAGHVRHGRGADDPAGQVRHGRGADDKPGHVRHGGGADDGPNHR